jgi:hypothetical protein
MPLSRWRPVPLRVRLVRLMSPTGRPSGDPPGPAANRRQRNTQAVESLSHCHVYTVARGSQHCHCIRFHSRPFNMLKPAASVSVPESPSLPLRLATFVCRPPSTTDRGGARPCDHSLSRSLLPHQRNNTARLRRAAKYEDVSESQPEREDTPTAAERRAGKGSCVCERACPRSCNVVVAQNSESPTRPSASAPGGSRRRARLDLVWGPSSNSSEKGVVTQHRAAQAEEGPAPRFILAAVHQMPSPDRRAAGRSTFRR